jgi:hypothetical protein
MSVFSKERTPRCHAYFPASTTINVFVMWIAFQDVRYGIIGYMADIL